MNVLELEHVDLVYHSAESLSYKNMLGIGKKSIINSYKALNDVSIAIEKGKVYGIVGSNGAGKSTLLRVLSGVMSPNSGNVTRNYKTISLLALGIGFSKELKGIDNIFLNGMLLGFSKKHISSLLEDIVEYSELGGFIDRPMKTYSSGMVSRLGFSIAIHLKPEVLLVDEVLSVGDAKFRQKSFASIQSVIKDKNTTVVIVSHGTGELESICDRVIWLDKGRVVAQGESPDILDLYAQFNKGQLSLDEIMPYVDSISVNGSGDFDVHSGTYSVRMIDAHTKYFLGKLTDHIKEYRSPSGELKLTKRTLHNGDFFLFFEYKGANARLNFVMDGIAEVFKYGHLYKKPPYDSRYGENKVSGLYAYFDLLTGSAVLSKIYCYQKKVREYEDGAESVVYEFIGENDSFDLNGKGFCANLDQRGKSAASLFFVLISKSKLFQNKENLDKYMEHYYDALFNNSVSNSFFVSPSGTYTKLPYSIEPFTKNGYGYSLHHSSRKDMIPFYEKTKERFFENFISNAVIQAYVYQTQNNDGMFQTTYTSTWLKKDTGITAPYVDTRLNETFILMLQDFQKHAPWLSSLEPMRGYADYLYSKYESGEQVYKIEDMDAIFFPDYFKDGFPCLAHTSLNHQLGIAQLMLRAQKKFNDRRFLKLFDAILRFVEFTCKNWIKENGDLYYGIRINAKGEKEYFDNDYVYVTLIDLLLIQNACISIDYGKNSAIDELIESKISYLRTTEHDIFSDNPKAASGEKIDSASYALNLYLKLDPSSNKLKRKFEISEIEVTSHCNLKCPYCNTSTTAYPKGFISDETFAAALRYIHPGQWVGFNGLGEPMLNKNLSKYVSQVAGKGAVPFLNTNGALLDAAKLDDLMNAGLRHLTVSAHTKAGIEAFRMCIGRLGELGFMLSPFNNRDKPMDNTFYILQRIILSPQAPILPEQMQILAEYPHLTEIINAHNWGNPIGKPLGEEAIKRKMRQCKAVIMPTAIMRWDGEFIVCCRDTENTVKLGNINNYEQIVQDVKSYRAICQYCF